VDVLRDWPQAWWVLVGTSRFWPNVSVARGLMRALAVMACILNVSAQSTSRVYALQFRERDQLSADIKFYCSEHYPKDKCKEHALALRNVLKHYPIQTLGRWSFILVSSGTWDDLLRVANGPPGSPTFSTLRYRDTFMSETLFLPSQLQQAEQMQLFGMGGPDLIEWAVSHELAHALCHQPNELLAQEDAREIRALSKSGPNDTQGLAPRLPANGPCKPMSQEQTTHEGKMDTRKIVTEIDAR
jgi:hypothetical protein